MVGNVKAAKVAKALGEKNSTLTISDTQQLTLFMDNASNDTRFGADMMLISAETHKIHCALCFEFKVSNNEVDEALIA